MGLTDEVTEDKTLDIQIRIAEIDAEFQKMLKAVSADNADGIDEERITELMNEKQRLTVQLEQYAAMRQKRENQGGLYRRHGNRDDAVNSLENRNGVM